MTGTLMVSRAVRLFPRIKKRLEELGFPDVEVTGEEKDSLNRVINEKKPRLVLVGSGFYKAGTPYMMGRLLKNFPKLNIAVINVGDFPDDLATWFIWRGVKSYVNILEGYEEFHHGLRDVREGKTYISPVVQKLMDDFPEWPKTSDELTKRQMETLIMICNGFIPEHIGEMLHVSRPTVNLHLKELYKTFHVENREELVKTAYALKLVTDKDLVFYDRENKIGLLPEWAVIKQKMQRRLLNVDKD
ncbi:MAG: LuxR C-terminal-related transcriptional regulator [Treponema sp.]|jgi:DNA-binding NarL/FixJ family response regulator|nr:LuxR C-terminal-related transcriptional regulator [Treponema sp.]